MLKAFETEDGYLVIPWGKKRLVVIFQGFQIGDVSTPRQATQLIKQHQIENPQGVINFLE